MAGFDIEGRFNVDLELRSMKEGMSQDLTRKIGQKVNWFRWQEYYLEENFDTIVDEIYDVSSSQAGEGRRWMLPFKLPVILAAIARGGNQMNDRGFYVVDSMRLVVNVGDLERLLPLIVQDEPNSFIRDRIEFRGQVFTPIRIQPNGLIGNNFTTVAIDCTEVNKEELVNDPQFARFAEPVEKDYRHG